MAEYNTNRLYWIKLTDRFMTSDTVDYLMSQKDGSNYVVLYQMLCLKTVNQNGVLARKLGEIIIPYDEEKIVRDCKYFSIDTVRIALTLYKNLGLIYEQEDGLFRIADFERLIGSQTISAEKKQIQLEKRRENQSLLGGWTNWWKKVENFPPDKEKDKDIYNTHTARAREREQFFSDFSISDDGCVSEDWNWTALTEAYHKSKKLLQCTPAAKCTSWIAQHYKSILAGKYEDRVDKPGSKNKVVERYTADELNAMFTRYTDEDDDEVNSGERYTADELNALFVHHTDEE